MRFIISNTIAALMSHPHRKFMYVEMYYLHKWWTDPRTQESERANLQTLVASKRWEFVMGGWVMPDESSPTYSAVMDQLAEGHAFLNSTFGVVPEIGYQIDPFGASTAVAQLYERAGFKYHIIDRIDYKLKLDLIQQKALEFYWAVTPGPEGGSVGARQIFTHILDDNYCFPMQETFNFEGNPLINPPIHSWDLGIRAAEYALLVRQRAAYYRSKHVLILHQCDFAYQNASLQFDNMDLVLQHIAQNPHTYNMTIRWSTLGEYFRSLHDKPASFWPLKKSQTDYFPYADDVDSWWTGYFTSRPQLKGQVRQAESALRVADTLSLPLVARKQAPSTMNPTELRRAHAVTQHHDAVAGTAKAFVVDHYAKLLQDGRDIAQKNTLTLLSQTSGQSSIFWSNTTEALQKLQPGSSVPVLVYNSLFHPRTDVVQIPIWTWKDISVSDAQGTPIKEYSALENMGQDLQTSPSTLFVNVKVPAAGWTIINVVRHHSFVNADPTVNNEPISNEFTTLGVDSSTGLLNHLTTHLNSLQPKTYRMKQQLMYYESYPGPGQASGAYIFRPIGEAKPLTTHVISVIRSTPFVKEIYQQIGTAFQTIRLYSGHDWVELSNWIGPIQGNTEVVSRWEIPFSSSPYLFQYDNNGILQFSHTRVDHKLIVPGNFKPSVYTGAADNNGAIFSSDRSHGVSSASPGSFEFMLHRRLLQDDARGLDEAMNDTSTINPKLRISFCLGMSGSEVSKKTYNATYGLNYPLEPFYYIGPNQYSGPSSYAPFEASTLPEGLHVSHFREFGIKQALISINALWTSNGAISYDASQLAPGIFCHYRRTTLTGMRTIERSSVATYRPGDIHTFIASYC